MRPTRVKVTRSGRHKTFVNYEDLSANNKIDENINNDIDFKKDYLLIESANIVNDYLNLNKKILVSKVE